MITKSTALSSSLLHIEICLKEQTWSIRAAFVITCSNTTMTQYFIVVVACVAMSSYSAVADRANITAAYCEGADDVVTETENCIMKIFVSHTS